MSYFIVILHICLTLVCVLCLAEYFRISLVEAMPVFLCGLVLILYGLAMVHHLSWIDWAAGIVTGIFAVWIVSRQKERRQEFGRVCFERIKQPSFLTAVLFLIVIVLCTSGKVVTWWDDINFWATDVKALYYLDGFAGKYGNVAPEFGDYPPGAQLVKWWFLHFSPGEFREGLAFAGYYVMNMTFLLPLLRKLKGWNLPVLFLSAAALWFFPSIAEVYGYDGFCADLTMACIYGAFLLAVTDKKGSAKNSYGEEPAHANAHPRPDSQVEQKAGSRQELFYYGRLALYLSVLVLVKSVGFVWALFGLIFLVLYQHSIFEKIKRKDVAGVAALPLLTGGSWMLFCLFMRRVTRTTATAVKYMTTDEYGLSGYMKEFAAAFLQAFTSSPLHKEKSIVIDLTPLGLYLCICLLVILFYRIHMLPQKAGRAVLCFSMISGAAFYGIIFLAHITIFATETQYLEASGMISSIERYGAPFTIGTLLFLAGIWLDHGEWFFARDSIPAFFRRYGTYLGVILFVALTAGYRVGYHGLVGYRNEADEKLGERAGMIGEDESQFLEAVQVLGKDLSARVCYIRRGDAPRWVNNSYLGYEVSPVSMVYQSVNLDDAPADWMVEQIRGTHAGYLYAEETDADAGAVFDGITESGDFTCGVLYRIEDTGTEMRLDRITDNAEETGSLQ